jgi:integrase
MDTVQTCAALSSASAGIADGRVFRAINKVGKVWDDGTTAKVIWGVVREGARRAGIDKLAPHDLRRTCPVSATSPVAN